MSREKDMEEKQEYTDHIDWDAAAKRLRKKYKIGIAAGIALIFLAAAAFIYVLATMPPHPSAVNWIECAGAAVLMTAAMIVVTIRLRKLQMSYFSGAAGAAEEYAAGLSRRIKNGEKK
jgi:protein-S-isoprenylcysteine O-methyltransferase Ste14